MADWNTHIYCALKVNEKLQFEGAKLEKFLYGNILPDVNMGWLLEPEVLLEQKVTHFDGMGQEYFFGPKKFFDKYEEKIREKNPIYLGYLFHLWLDVSIMTNYVSKVPMSEIVMHGSEVREWKWNDMAVFIKKFSYDLSSDYISEILEECKGIEEVKVTSKELMMIPGLLKQTRLENTSKQYLHFDEKMMKEFYSVICKDFTDWIRNLEVDVK